VFFSAEKEEALKGRENFIVSKTMRKPFTVDLCVEN